jgi:hypothetical protein
MELCDLEASLMEVAEMVDLGGSRRAAASASCLFSETAWVTKRGESLNLVQVFPGPRPAKLTDWLYNRFQDSCEQKFSVIL